MLTAAEPTTADLVAAAKRSGGLAAALAAELEAMQRRLAVAKETIDLHCERTGPEYLVDVDLQLAAWLAEVAATHPMLEEPTAPLGWSAADRAKLEELIEQCRGMDRNDQRTLAEQLQIHEAIRELCDENGADPELADAIIMRDVPPPIAFRAAA